MSFLLENETEAAIVIYHLAWYNSAMSKEPEKSIGVSVPGDSGIMVTTSRGHELLSERLEIESFRAKMPVPEGHDWVHLYVACADEKADATIEAIRSGIGIPDEATFHTTVNPREISIRDEVVGLLSQIQSALGTSVLIIAKGYERYFMPGKENPYRVDRGAHDYDQDLREGRSLRDAPELEGKRIFVLTHVGTSLGQAVYDRSVQSLTSGFVNDKYIVDPPSYLQYLSQKSQ